MLVALDARMGEVYWGGFEWDGVAMAPVFDESVGPPDAVRAPDGDGWAGAGPGWSAYRAVLEERLADHLGCRPDMADAERLPEAIDMLVPAKLAFEGGTCRRARGRDARVPAQQRRAGRTQAARLSSTATAA